MSNSYAGLLSAALPTGAHLRLHGSRSEFICFLISSAPPPEQQIGTQTMTIHGKYVAYPTIQRKLTINPCEDSGTLSKGQHTFAWSFIAPANTA
jgi:hypothetical protein